MAPDVIPGAEVDGRGGADRLLTSESSASVGILLTSMFATKCHECLPTVCGQERVKQSYIFQKIRGGCGLHKDLHIILNNTKILIV